MAGFTTEETVRRKFQIEDVTLASQALLLASIDDAHEEVLRRLDPAVDIETPEASLVLGETLLAGARLLGSLASKDAVLQKDITVGGQRIEAGKRFASLITLGEKAEEQAWEVLEPYLSARSCAPLGGVTDTVPVLGES